MGSWQRSRLDWTTRSTGRKMRPAGRRRLRRARARRAHESRGRRGPPARRRSLRGGVPRAPPEAELFSVWRTDAGLLAGKPRARRPQGLSSWLLGSLQTRGPCTPAHLRHFLDAVGADDVHQDGRVGLHVRLEGADHQLCLDPVPMVVDPLTPRANPDRRPEGPLEGRSVGPNG
jgi:hypothetical protein